MTIDGSKCTDDFTSLSYPLKSRLNWHTTNKIKTLLTNQVNIPSLIPTTDVIQLTLTLKMTTAQVVETSVTVNNNNNSPIQDFVHPDDHPCTQPLTYKMTPGSWYDKEMMYLAMMFQFWIINTIYKARNPSDPKNPSRNFLNPFFSLFALDII